MNKLAAFGGKPVRDTLLSYGKQLIEEDDIDAVINVLKGDYLTTGPFVSDFEDKVKEYVDTHYAVAVSNGTAALHAACFAAGLQEGDEVLVSSITFAASSNAVLYCGATPVFVDIDPKTYNISIEDLRAKITEKTKAMVVVDFTGQSVEIDEIMAIARENNLVVIEDGAHSLGSEYKGKKVGNKADLTTFSFHPVKPITTAEGGMVVTNNPDYYNKLIKFRSHGITRNIDEIEDFHGPWYNEQQLLGYNYRLTDVQAALGSNQMNKIDSFISRRREIVRQYNNAFKSIKELQLPYEPEFSNSGWHIYVILLNLELLKADRKEIFVALQKENIGVNVHYLPVYKHKYYQENGYEQVRCQVAEDFYQRAITIPLHPSMTDEDVESVVEAVKKVIDYYGVENA